MGKVVDACGMTCPTPVVSVRDALEQTNPEELTVLVDNPAALESVKSYLCSKGYSVTTSKEEDTYYLKACHSQENPILRKSPAKASADQQAQKILMLVTTDCLGSGDDVLGGKLMTTYLKTLKEMGPDLWQLIFVNSGVKLTTASSPVLENLQDYEKSGVIILACGTCLEHFGLTTEKKVGGTTNMLDIVAASHLADKVITIC